MAITYYFFDAVESGGVYDREYSADDFTSYYADVVGNGVVSTDNDNKMAVARRTGLGIKVQSGQAFIQGCKIVNSSDKNFTLDAAHASYGRYDLVYAVLDRASRTMNLAVKKGTPSASPVEPTYSATELPLAYVYVGAGKTSLSNNDITDLRGTADCRWIMATGPLKAAIDSTDSTVAGLQLTVNAQGNQLSLINNTVNGHTTSINSLSSTVTAQGNQLSLINNTVNGHTISINSLLSSVTTLNDEVQNMKMISATSTKRYIDITLVDGTKYQGTALVMCSSNKCAFIRLNGSTIDITHIAGSGITATWTQGSSRYTIDCGADTLPAIILGGRAANSSVSFRASE